VSLKCCNNLASRLWWSCPCALWRQFNLRCAGLALDDGVEFNIRSEI
jgi:hypothetical protein